MKHGLVLVLHVFFGGFFTLRYAVRFLRYPIVLLAFALLTPSRDAPEIAFFIRPSYP